MAVNTKGYIQHFLKIKTKEGKITPFVLNTSQLKLYNAIATQHKQKKPIRVIILKARQMGFSTLTEGIIFKNTVTKSNVASGIVTHEIAATNNLFKISKRYYDNLEEGVKPALKASNAKELVFSFNNGTSSIKCMTAGNSSIGRSDTFQNLHISEYAFWKGDKKETLTGLLQAVPNQPNTMVIIESTANGYEDFKDMWDKAVQKENDFIPVFCAWQEHEEYQMPYTNFRLTKDEKQLTDLYNLSLEQLSWRRWCIKNNCRGSEAKFKQEYPSCAEEAFLMSGSPVFNNQKIHKHIHNLEKKYSKTPYKEGIFTYRWNNEKYKDQITDYTLTKGVGIRIYEDPQKGVPYVIGADTKGEGKDYFGATVINNATGDRVATLHMQCEESKPFTHQLYCLGKHYNNALIGVEINFNTAPVEELVRLGYPKQYVRRKYDDFTKAIQSKYGFKTDGNTRPILIDKEIDSINNNLEQFSDIPTLREALTFVYDKNNRPDAIKGKHDDLLFSDMIANEIRSQQDYKQEVQPQAEKRKWTKDMWEDYNNATQKDKDYLLTKWGTPE